MLKNKVQKLFISIAMAFLFALTCMIPTLTMKKASADTPMPRTNTQIQNCDTLHFFSDQPQHESFCLSLQADGIINDYEFYSLVTGVEDCYDAGRGAYAALQNEYVVFELEDQLPRQVDDPNVMDIIPDYLLAMFSTMKENGCHIMFICGTDEAMFVTHNQFLDYVDIHVNTDIMDIFVMNIFYRLVQANNGDMQLENFTFFLDMNFSQDIHLGYNDSWFFYTYFIPYFRSVYRTEILQDDLSSQELFDLYSIKILCHVANNGFYDPIHNVYVAGTFNELEPYIENQQLCAIGRATSNQTYSHAWLQLMIELRNSLDLDLPIYIYENVAYSFTEYEEPDVYKTGQATGLYSILEDFLTDEDLTGYGNWGGRCEITHKTLPSGSDGWMIYLSPEDFFVLGWQRYMGEEDYEYFFGDSNTW